jgi:hypothetical protein
MTSRAAIEEQIRLLNEQLVASTAYDPEFTPKELVRWNPDLIGTVLHCEHTPQKFNIRDFDVMWLHLNAEVFGIITDKGILANIEPTPTPSPGDIITFEKEEIYNNFISITKFKCPLRAHGCDTQKSSYIHYECKIKELHLDAMIEYEFLNGHIRGILNLTLVPVSQSILDHIYVTSIIRLPQQNKDIVIHKYPLSHLYKKWKQEKNALATIPKGLPIVATATASAEPEDPRTKP